MKNFIFGLGLLGSSFVSGAELRAPIAAPQVQVGDSWTYQYTDVWKNEPGHENRVEVTAVNDDGIEADLKRADTGALVSHQHFSREMNPFDRGQAHFATAFARFAFPLEVGKKWSSEADAENPAAGKHWRYQIEGRALAWERIKVLAGEFDAIKIEVTAYYQNDEIGRNRGSSKATETLWYAPAVKNFVKLDYLDMDRHGRVAKRDMWELTAYTALRDPVVGGPGASR